MEKDYIKTISPPLYMDTILEYNKCNIQTKLQNIKNTVTYGSNEFTSVGGSINPDDNVFYGGGGDAGNGITTDYEDFNDFVEISN